MSKPSSSSSSSTSTSTGVDIQKLQTALVGAVTSVFSNMNKPNSDDDDADIFVQRPLRQRYIHSMTDKLITYNQILPFSALRGVILYS